MQELKELITLLTHYKVDSVQLFPSQDNGETLYYKLYEAIKADALKSDEDALSYLYTGEEEDSEEAYQKLKYRLKKKLQNALLQIDLNAPEFSNYQLAYMNSLKYWGIVQMLLLHGKRNLAIPIAKNIYQKARKFELTDLLLLLSKDLRLHYGTIAGDKRQFLRYHEEFIKYQEIFRIEELAEGYYTELAMNLVNTKSVDDPIIEMAEQYAEELNKLKEECNSYKFNLLRFTINTMRYEIVADVENTLKVCDEAIHFFQTGKRNSNIALFTFLFKKLGAYIRLQEFEAGAETAEQCLPLVQRGSANWFFTRDYYTLLAFKCGKYEEAKDIYLNTITRKEFKTLGKGASENWKIYEAYLHFFIETGHLEPDPDNDELLKSFKLGKFLNEVPTYSKDKRGMNVSILILQMLFLLVKQRHDDVLDRIEALNQYCYRYLRKDDTFRSNCFIKMLLEIPKAHFHKEGVKRKAAKYYERLQEVSQKESNQPLEIEIIPYEKLWDIILENLDNSFH